MKSAYSDGSFYKANIRYNPFIAEMVETLSKGIVIDFGCGLGTNLYNLVKIGWEAYAVDIEPIAVQRIKSILPSDHVFLSEIENFDFNQIPNVDLVLCNYVFQHMSAVEIERFINNISLKVKTNGHFILSFFRNRGELGFIEVSNCFNKNGWRLLQKKEWRRKDTDHGTPHIHEGIESFWCKI